MEAVFWTIATIVILALGALTVVDMVRKAQGKPTLMVGSRGITLTALWDQRRFSETTFGPMDRDARLHGVIDHIRKELDEIEADPKDLNEWVDVIILAIDGAHRAGYLPDEITGAYKAKMRKNWRRSWPDWRTMPEDKAIEHVRGIHD